ncbi:Protein disulfide-isomerase [Durusdinium trenchii]|uniref:Protein disulfide-isomerase n=1 Tax=Durusdinium trenchii TaxID=1381693 RepID=A0ABP0K167_9DINO
MGWGGCGKDWGAGGDGGWGGGGWGGGGGKGFGGKGFDKGCSGKGYGGGCGKGGGPGSNWGGAGVWQPMFNPMMAMMMKGMGKQTTGLRNFANDRKVWVGGLPANQMSKEINMKLKEHMSTAGVTCLYAEIGKSGSGGAAFKSNSEAMTAAAALNGSEFEGVMLQVDMWGKKPPM